MECMSPLDLYKIPMIRGSVGSLQDPNDPSVSRDVWLSLWSWPPFRDLISIGAILTNRMRSFFAQPHSAFMTWPGHNNDPVGVVIDTIEELAREKRKF